MLYSSPLQAVTTADFFPNRGFVRRSYDKFEKRWEYYQQEDDDEYIHLLYSMPVFDKIEFDRDLTIVTKITKNFPTNIFEVNNIIIL
jgi:hypothetical protein